MQHQTITSIIFLETSESFDAAEVTKLDQRTSTVTLQKENNIKDAIAASSGELELGFHPEIHQQSQEIPRQRLRGETTQKKMSPLSIPTQDRFAWSSCRAAPPPHHEAMVMPLSRSA